jgi:hypothetical protein
MSNNDSFFGSSYCNIEEEEIELFNSMKPYNHFLQYLINENLTKWFAKLKNEFEKPVIKCHFCRKETQRSFMARREFERSKFYTCSDDCKAKLKSRTKKERKDEYKKSSISEMLGKTKQWSGGPFKPSRASLPIG